MSEETKLLPCPFCGGEEIERLGWGYYAAVRKAYRRCTKCGAETGKQDFAIDSDQIWNTRASGWIPTEERIPTVYGRYLVQDRLGNWSNFGFRPGFDEEEFRRREFVAWLELEPYKLV